MRKWSGWLYLKHFKRLICKTTVTRSSTSPDLVDLHRVGILQQQEFALGSDQAGDGVNHFCVPGLSWDLPHRRTVDERIDEPDTDQKDVNRTLTGVSLPPPSPPLWNRSWRRVLLFLLILLIDCFWSTPLARTQRDVYVKGLASWEEPKLCRTRMTHTWNNAPLISPSLHLNAYISCIIVIIVE